MHLIKIFFDFNMIHRRHDKSARPCFFGNSDDVWKINSCQHTRWLPTSICIWVMYRYILPQSFKEFESQVVEEKNVEQGRDLRLWIIGLLCTGYPDHWQRSCLRRVLESNQQLGETPATRRYRLRYLDCLWPIVACSICHLAGSGPDSSNDGTIITSFIAQY